MSTGTISPQQPAVPVRHRLNIDALTAAQLAAFRAAIAASMKITDERGYNYQAGKNVELEQYTQALYDARELAMERMQKEAEAIGDGVLGIVEVKLHENNHGWGSHTIEFFAGGTAIVPREGHDESIEAPTTVLDLS